MPQASNPSVRVSGFLRVAGAALVCAGVLPDGPVLAAARDQTPAAPTVQVPAAPGQTPADPIPVPTLTPAQVQQIQQSLNHPAGIRLDERQLRFYLEIVAKQPSFAEYSRGYDFVNGPTRRGNPMTHKEFLNIVTPQEMFSSVGFNANEQLQIAITNWIGKSLIRRALEELKNAKTSDEAQEIRERIDRELAALTGSVRGK